MSQRFFLLFLLAALMCCASCAMVDPLPHAVVFEPVAPSVRKVSPVDPERDFEPRFQVYDEETRQWYEAAQGEDGTWRRNEDGEARYQKELARMKESAKAATKMEAVHGAGDEVILRKEADAPPLPATGVASAPSPSAAPASEPVAILPPEETPPAAEIPAETPAEIPAEAPGASPAPVEIAAQEPAQEPVAIEPQPIEPQAAPGQQPVAQTPATPAAPETAVSEAVAPEVTGGDGPVSILPPADPAPVSAPAPEAESAAPQPSVAAAPEEISPAPKQVVEDHGPKGAGAITITARQGTWVTTIIDGAARRDYFLTAGQELSVQFNQFCLVTIGDTDAVSLQYNGENYPLYLRSGKEMRFPPSM